jgi:hypothetical protein
MAHERRAEEPVDRLTRMCSAMTTVFEAHSEHRPDDKCIVFLDDGKRGGIQLFGYEDDTEAMVDLLVHIQALFRANGREIKFAGLPGNPLDN